MTDAEDLDVVSVAVDSLVEVPLETDDELEAKVWRCQCGAAWVGLTTCHCPTCHETFSAPSSFDAHRPGGRCLMPDQVVDREGRPKLRRVPRGEWFVWAGIWDRDSGGDDPAGADTSGVSR